MRKIISLYRRDYDGNRQVFDAVVPGAEWVLAGEGVPTMKWDGTSCLWKDGRLWKRYDAKHGKPAPQGFVPAQDPDDKTGHWPGWLPVADGPEDRWHNDGVLNTRMTTATNPFDEGRTYELVGPKVQGNPHGYGEHRLIPHGAHVVHDAPRRFAELRQFFAAHAIEGIVWWRRWPWEPGLETELVKIKRKDFGLPWPLERVR